MTKMKNKFYITSAIPYVNAKPHIGHAQEFVYADVIRRKKIMDGYEVTYLSGADENALKIYQASQKAGQMTQEFIDIHNQEFLSVAETLHVKFDIWQRGSDQIKHFPSSQKLWNLCKSNDDIYKKNYTGLYCVGCETFYAKDELDEKGECIEHPGKKLDEITEENYFFKLSKYQNFIEDLISTDKLKIIPEVRKNEALSFVKKGLEDFSISRSRERACGWGIPVPDDPNQIIYVWFDALNIYQTGIGFGSEDKQYKKLWPADIHVIGKGIIRFHAIYWPAILKSAGLEMPKEIFVHGYLTVDGQKMSKTIGNVIDPLEIVKEFGTDATRYYLLREIPSTKDGDFSKSRFLEVYNADLANGLGNLVSRVLALCSQNSITFDPTPEESNIVVDRLKELDYFKILDTHAFNLALEILWKEYKNIDNEINEFQPWNKTGEELEVQLKSYLRYIRDITFYLSPFLPETSEKILQNTTGKIEKVPSLFPRMK